MDESDSTPIREEENDQLYDEVDSKAVEPSEEFDQWEQKNYEIDQYTNLAKYFIFNHETFQLKLSRREGTNEDVKALKQVLGELNCVEGEIYQDLLYSEIKTAIKNAAKADYDDCAAVIVAILTHGEEGILFAKDKKYSLNELWEPFISSNTLYGKPKIFIIQACQGTEADPGRETISIDPVVIPAQKTKMPVFADFLFLFSSPPGYCAFRGGGGSWMVQTLCSALHHLKNDLDIESIFTAVQYCIAHQKQSYCRVEKFHEKKQMPFKSSTLTKRFHLTQKCIEQLQTEKSEMLVDSFEPFYKTKKRTFISYFIGNYKNLKHSSDCDEQNDSNENKSGFGSILNKENLLTFASSAILIAIGVLIPAIWSKFIEYIDE